MSIEYTLDPEDISSARLMALGIRPQREVALFGCGMAALLALSVSPWSFGLLPLLIGLTACLAAFRIMQIGRVREAALAAYQRNPTLRQPTVATWDERGVSIRPRNSPCEFVSWAEVQPLRENARIVLLRQATGAIHAIPKRAADKTTLMALRRLARSAARRDGPANPAM